MYLNQTIFSLRSPRLGGEPSENLRMPRKYHGWQRKRRKKELPAYRGAFHFSAGANTPAAMWFGLLITRGAYAARANRLPRALMDLRLVPVLGMSGAPAGGVGRSAAAAHEFAAFSH